jgi:hypothetical protein
MNSPSNAQMIVQEGYVSKDLIVITFAFDLNRFGPTSFEKYINKS